jgi:hypothetical protein
VRLRALPLLLVLTVADYALWDWSIADGHDILSLIAGLTLLPLAAATLALLAVGAARLLSLALKRRAAHRHSAGKTTRRRGRARTKPPAPASTQPAETAAHERTSRRLAA